MKKNINLDTIAAELFDARQLLLAERDYLDDISDLSFKCDKQEEHSKEFLAYEVSRFIARVISLNCVVTDKLDAIEKAIEEKAVGGSHE